MAPIAYPLAANTSSDISDMEHCFTSAADTKVKQRQARWARLDGLETGTLPQWAIEVEGHNWLVRNVSGLLLVAFVTPRVRDLESTEALHYRRQAITYMFPHRLVRQKWVIGADSLCQGRVKPLGNLVRRAAVS